MHAYDTPIIEFDEAQLEQSINQHALSLIDHIRGHRMSCKTLQQGLPLVWRLISAVEIIELCNNFFLFLFESKLDLIKVHTGSLWTVVGQQLTVTHWILNFSWKGLIFQYG